jgi:hypothetical protein
MRTHATSCIGGTGLKIFNGFLIFFNGFPIFLNGFPIFLNSFLLSEKSEKIYLRQEVYKRSLFELCIFCHLLSHSLSELRNTRYNTQQRRQRQRSGSSSSSAVAGSLVAAAAAWRQQLGSSVAAAAGCF